MKNDRLKLCALVLALTLVLGLFSAPFSAFAADEPARTTGHRSGEELLAGKSYVPQRVNVLLRAADLQIGRPLPGLEKITVDLAVELDEGMTLACVSGNGLTTAEMLDVLRDDPRVILVEPDYLLKKQALTDDPLLDFQWTMENKHQNGFKDNYDIAPEKLFATPSSEEDLVIVSIDTGVDYTHEDLIDKMWVNPLEIPGNGIDDDNNGYIDDIHGINATSERMDGDPIPYPGEENRHATHTAGIMLAEANNALGITGVAGNCKNVKLISVNIASENASLSTGAAIRGYAYIHQLITRKESPIRAIAINNSWGCDGEFPYALEAMIDLLGRDGVLSVIACGNDGVDFNAGLNMDEFCDYLGYHRDEPYSPTWDDYNGREYTFRMNIFPAISESPYVVRVSAMTGNGTLAGFSNRGYDFSDIAAPGSNILSTVSEYSFVPSIYTSEELASRTAVFISEDFAFRKNAADPFGNNAQITIRNNERNNTYFSNNSSKDQVSVNIEIKNAQAKYPYLIELPYHTEKLVNEQDPFLAFTATLLDYPRNLDVDTPFLCLFTEGPASEPVKSRAQVSTIGKRDEVQDIFSFKVDPTTWRVAQHKMPKKQGTDRVLRLYFFPTVNGDYTVSFDNYALSSGKLKEEETFGKYEYMCGTSMATPTVTGALALLAAKDPSLDTPEKLKESLLNHTRQLAALDGKVRRSLALDLSASCDHDRIPLIQSVDYEDGLITLKGKALDGTTLTVNGRPVAVRTASESMITAAFEAENMEPYSVRLDSSRGYSTGSFMGFAGTAYTTSVGEDGSYPIMPDYNFATDGQNFYMLGHIDPNIEVYAPSASDPDHMELVRTIPYDFEAFLDGFYGDNPYFMLDLGESSRCEIDSFRYYDGSVYFIVSGKNRIQYYSADEFEPDEFDSIYRIPVKSELIRVDLASGKTSILQLPADLWAPTLGFYDGQILLAGGFDLKTNRLTDTTYVGDGKTWTAVASLPEKRAYGTLVAAADKLYWIGGTNEQCTEGDGTAPDMLIWNGTRWTRSGLLLRYNQFVATGIDRVNYPRYEMNASPVKGGLLFTDRIFSDAQGTPLGDTLKYDAATGTLSDYGFYAHRTPIDHVRGTVVGDTYRGFTIKEKRTVLERTAYVDGENIPGYSIYAVLNGYDQSFPVKASDILVSPNGPGTLKIVLTSEDGKVENMPFLVTASGLTVNHFSRVFYTDAEGIIELTGLMPGSYTVSETPGTVNELYTLPADEIARVPFDGTAVVSMKNVLTVPPIPDTGDTATPLFWFLLIAGSVSCLMLVIGKHGKLKKN